MYPWSQSHIREVEFHWLPEGHDTQLPFISFVNPTIHSQISVLIFKELFCGHCIQPPSLSCEDPDPHVQVLLLLLYVFEGILQAIQFPWGLS